MRSTARPVAGRRTGLNTHLDRDECITSAMKSANVAGCVATGSEWRSRRVALEVANGVAGTNVSGFVAYVGFGGPFGPGHSANAPRTRPFSRTAASSTESIEARNSRCAARISPIFAAQPSRRRFGGLRRQKR